MKNTITLALSLTAIKQDVSAQCAWVDVTNLATLPPIVNPADNTDIDTVIMASISKICSRLSGYIINTHINDEIYKIEMSLPHISGHRAPTLSQLITKCVIYETLNELYTTQKQASHITSLFQHKRDVTTNRIIQLLAYTN